MVVELDEVPVEIRPHHGREFVRPLVEIADLLQEIFSKLLGVLVVGRCLNPHLLGLVPCQVYLFSQVPDFHCHIIEIDAEEQPDRY